MKLIIKNFFDPSIHFSAPISTLFQSGSPFEGTEDGVRTLRASGGVILIFFALVLPVQRSLGEVGNLLKGFFENLNNIRKCIFSSARPECFCKAKMYRRVKRKINYDKFFYVAPFDTFYYVSLRRILRASGGTNICYIIIIACLITSNFICAFSHDSAIYAAQNGNWQDAYASLNNILVNNPDDAAVLYDAGVAAHHLNHAGQAAACFTRAAECAKEDDLCFRAHFCAGNACVDNKDLKCALKHYDKALSIQPENEQVRHNRDHVAEMLKEQENKQQQQDDSSSDKASDDKQKDKDKQQDKQSGNEENEDNGNDNNEQNGDEQNKQQGNNQQEQNGNDGQNGNQNDDQSQKGNDKQDSDSSQDQLNKQSQGDQEGDIKRDDRNAQRKEQGNKERQQHKNSTDDHKRDGNQELDKATGGNEHERQEQHGKKHNTTPEKENEPNGKHNASAAAGQEQDEDGDDYGAMKIDDPWLLQVLNDQEQKDKAVNKQLMEAKIRQQGGKNGQNCW